MPPTDGRTLRSEVSAFLLLSLAAACGGGSGGSSDPTVPNAPSGLTATASSSSTIHLAWTDTSTDESGFKLERSPDGSSGWTQLATPAANATSYDDTGLSASTAYSYRIRATNPGGDSSYSSVASATTSAPPVTPPPAPSGLTATATSSSSIHLTWTDNSTDESRFELERSPDGSSGWTQIAAPSADATSYDDTGLSASTAYSYRIRATNAGGDSSYSNTASATTSAAPIITGGPCASGATGSTAFRIKWLDDGGTADVSYEVVGLPNSSQLTAGAYGYSLPFTPAFVDQYLGAGGLDLDTSDFVDISFSTAGISSISHATLSIFGRSYSTTASGSFSWQTFDGSGSTPTDSVSNATPYRWYSADMASGIGPAETNGLLRIKAGPSSEALVVSQIELCLDAQ